MCLYALSFLSFVPSFPFILSCGSSFPFILALCGFNSYHFWFLWLSFAFLLAFCGFNSYRFWCLCLSFPFILTFCAFISFHFCVLCLHFFPFLAFCGFIFCVLCLHFFPFLAFCRFISLHFGLLCLHFLSFWVLVALFPFILGFCAFISFHFGFSSKKIESEDACGAIGRKTLFRTRNCKCRKKCLKRGMVLSAGVCLLAGHTQRKLQHTNPHTHKNPYYTRRLFLILCCVFFFRCAHELLSSLVGVAFISHKMGCRASKPVRSRQQGAEKKKRIFRFMKICVFALCPLYWRFHAQHREMKKIESEDAFGAIGRKTLFRTRNCKCRKKV